MNSFKKRFLILFILINIAVYAQDNKEVLYAEIVVLADESLMNQINSLNLKNHCIRKGENWYLDFTKEDYSILSKARLKNRIPTVEAKNTIIYLTLINDDVFFIFCNNEENLPIKKTGFKADLSEFLNSHNYSIEESSYWILIERNGKMEVIKEILFSCN